MRTLSFILFLPFTVSLSNEGPPPLIYSDVPPKFIMVEERSLNGAPSVSVTFSDGYHDNLVLNRYDPNDEDRMANKEHCNFIGHLENEPEACVAMTGCFGSEDVHFTILSKHARMLTSSMFTWKKDGNVEVIDRMNGLNGPMRKAIPTPRVGIPPIQTTGPPSISKVERKGDEIFVLVQEAALNKAEANCAGSGTCSLPATQHLQVRVGYDDGMWNEFNKVASAVDNYIASVWTHVQTNFCHQTLGSKVLVEKLNGNKYYSGISLAGDDMSLMKMFQHTKNDLGNADLMLYFGHIGSNYPSGGGIAYEPVVCVAGIDQYKQSINNYGTSHSAMGELLTHELGHNLGMAHDFEKKHGGNGNSGSGGPCDFKGFMSYGNHESQWSTCSVKDFTAHYEEKKSSWCLPAAPKACGGQITATCTDANEHTANCPAWAAQGFCSPSSEHFDFMSANCAKSCNKCQSGNDVICKDSSDYATSCPYWVSVGECSKNPGFMLVNCKKSCNACN